MVAHLPRWAEVCLWLDVSHFPQNENAPPYQPRRREHEAYFRCDGFADRRDSPSGRTTTGQPTEGRGIGAISLCAMPCRAQWPNALSQSNGTKLFKCCKVAGHDRNGPSRMDAIVSPNHAQYRFRRRREKQRRYLYPQPKGRKIDTVDRKVLGAVRQPQAYGNNEINLYRQAKPTARLWHDRHPKRTFGKRAGATWVLGQPFPCRTTLDTLFAKSRGSKSLLARSPSERLSV